MKYFSIPLKSSLITGTLVLLVFFFLLGYFTMMLGGLSVIENQSRESLKYQLSFLKNYVEQEMADEEIAEIRQVISQLSTLPESIYVAVLDDEGRIMLSNRLAWKGLLLHEVVPEFSLYQDVSASEDVKYHHLIVNDDHEWIDGYQTYLLPADVNQLRSDRHGLIYIRYDLTYARDTVLQLLYANIPLLVVLVVILMGLVFLFIRRYLTIPIDGLVGHARKLALGDYKSDIQVEGRGELAELAYAFNELRHSVSYNIDALKKSGDELEQRVVERTEELRKSEELARTIVETANDAVIVIDHRGLITAFNDSAVLMFGYSEQEVTGKNISILMPESYRTMHDTYITNYLEKKTPAFVLGKQRELQGMRKNGEVFPIELSANKIFSEGEISFVGFIRDITQRKRIEDELKTARLQAEEANQAKSIFLANMSHEIRTPMNVIMGMTELAIKTGSESKRLNYIEKSNQAARNLLGIINDILDFSKIEAGKIELEETVFDLSEVLNNVATVVRFNAFEKQVRFVVTAAADLPAYVKGDPLRLHQVILNLCNNAVKFSYEGSDVSLSVMLLDSQDDNLQLQFEVADKGIGIPQDKIDGLFQSFSQVDSSTSRRFGGTGLGLSISRQLVGLMKGEIWVKSRESEGSQFFFTASFKPVSDEERLSLEQTAEMDLEDAMARLNGKRVLLVDDNALNQELERDLLEDAGIEVTSAYDGKQALDMLERRGFDLVLMDCQMPVMDGYEATLKIRENPQFKELPIIAMSANVMKQEIDHAFESGMNDSIPKPVDTDQMFITMAKWIDRA